MSNDNNENGRNYRKSGNKLPADLRNKKRLPGTMDGKDPIKGILAQFENLMNLKTIKRMSKQAEVVVVGGGIVGSFVAYWVKRDNPNSNVVVVERDPTYTQSSTFLSVGGFRQQFSLPENIEMSMFGVEFLRNAQENLKCTEKVKPIDLQFNQDGYLFLANTKPMAEKMFANHKVQLTKGAHVKLLDKRELKSTFKWINPDDIELASFGHLNEGWVDARKYLLAVRNAATYLGVEFVNGELVAFENRNKEAVSGRQASDRTINTALIHTSNDEIAPIDFRYCVNAAGPWAANIARLAGIGNDMFDGQDEDENDLTQFSVSLPVEARKRYIYMFYAENGPILNVPLTIDPTGVWFKRHGLSNYYICGLNNTESTEPDNLNLQDIDYDYFEKRIRPVLLDRCQSFENLKMVNAWAGFYEYNTLDQNLIIGHHPSLENFIFANGSSGHGIQHACAIGKAVSELVVYGEYKTVDLKRMGFDRILNDQPLKESEIV